MKSLPFNPVVPGIRTLWMIHFNHDGKKPPINFFIPSPFNPNEWMLSDIQSNQQALDLLQKINKACGQIKNECKNEEMIQTFRDYVQKAQGVFTHLEDLETLVKNFDDLMKRFSRPPSNEDETEEGKSD